MNRGDGYRSVINKIGSSGEENIRDSMMNKKKRGGFSDGRTNGDETSNITRL